MNIANVNINEPSQVTGYNYIICIVICTVLMQTCCANVNINEPSQVIPAAIYGQVTGYN